MCNHKFKSIDSAYVYVGNKPKLIDSYQCILCGKWYFRDRASGKREFFHNGYKGDEVEDDFK